MKKILLLAALTIGFTQLNAQKQFGTRNAKVSFIATNDDDVKAVNNEVASRLSDNGQLSFSLLIKGFKFEYAEMQEKFNNDYAESNKFPRAEFKGNLTLHGVTKPLTVNGLITVKAGKVSATGKFPIIMKDFNIDASAVTEKVNADINAVYQ
jgi:hypothetical protein